MQSSILAGNGKQLLGAYGGYYDRENLWRKKHRKLSSHVRRSRVEVRYVPPTSPMLASTKGEVVR